MNEILKFLTLESAGLPMVIWIIFGILLSIVTLRVRSLRIKFKGRDRELTLETNNEPDGDEKQKRDSPAYAPREKERMQEKEFGMPSKK